MRHQYAVVRFDTGQRLCFSNCSTHRVIGQWVCRTYLVDGPVRLSCLLSLLGGSAMGPETLEHDLPCAQLVPASKAGLDRLKASASSAGACVPRTSAAWASDQVTRRFCTRRSAFVTDRSQRA
jgi:hypothetical protein